MILMDVERTLSELVAINSVFPKEDKVAIYLEKELKMQNFKTTRQYVENGRFNLFAERGRGKKSILFYGHMDTVPVYGKWKRSPLTLTKSKGKLLGLGSQDMKAGIAATMESVKGFENKRIKLLFCVDEENISKGAWAAVKGKKTWFKDVGLMISGEPGNSKENHGGVNKPTLGRRGRCVLSIHINGRSAHGALSGRGESALEAAAQIATHITGMRLRKHKELGDESLFVRKLESASTSLSIPDHAYMELDIHMVPPTTINGIRKNVETFITGLKRRGILHNGITVKVSLRKRDTPYLEPYVTDMKNNEVKKVLKTIEDNFGNPKINYGMSVADENAFANEMHFPVMAIGAEGGNAHSANEWISRESIHDLVRLYKSIITEF